MWSLRRKTETGSFRFSGRSVEYRYSRDTDVLRLRISDRPIARTAELDLGLVDLDSEGNIVSIEVFAASKAVPEIAREFEDVKPSLEEDLNRAVTSYVSEARDQVPITS